MAIIPIKPRMDTAPAAKARRGAASLMFPSESSSSRDSWFNASRNPSNIVRATQSRPSVCRQFGCFTKCSSSVQTLLAAPRSEAHPEAVTESRRRGRCIMIPTTEARQRRSHERSGETRRVCQRHAAQGTYSGFHTNNCGPLRSRPRSEGNKCEPALWHVLSASDCQRRELSCPRVECGQVVRRVAGPGHVAGALSASQGVATASGRYWLNRPAMTSTASLVESVE